MSVIGRMFHISKRFTNPVKFSTFVRLTAAAYGCSTKWNKHADRETRGVSADMSGAGLASFWAGPMPHARCAAELALRVGMAPRRTNHRGGPELRQHRVLAWNLLRSFPDQAGGT